MAPTTKAAPPPPETIEGDTATVAGDGGGGALGHPRVYIDLARDGTLSASLQAIVDKVELREDSMGTRI
ncbi:MAG: zinc-finger domain-containing protein, partial [Alphaproteobacteria bacterium]